MNNLSLFRGFAAVSGKSSGGYHTSSIDPYLVEAIKDALSLAQLAYQYPDRAAQGMLAAMGLQNLSGGYGTVSPHRG